MSLKKNRSTKQQIKKMVEYMSSNNHLATGEFTGPLGAKRALSQWQELKKLLDECGPDRTIDQWKQTWKDLKKGARTENAAAVRSRNATGNSQAIPIVSDIGMQILNTIGHESSVGIGPPESQIGQHLSEEIIEMVVEAPIPIPVVEEHEVQPTPTSSRTIRSLPLGGRVQHADLFASLQEQNNSILQQIQNNMVERNQLLKEQNKLIEAQNIHLAEANCLRRMKRYSRRFSF